ncbi:MAG: CpXC domain-containing protein [Bacteroidales bacterium]|nr:CpXC domain-containing protein [Bacteroidales bacterium]
MSEIKASCSRCGAQFSAEVPQSVNAAVSSDLKEQVRSGALFTRACPVCGTVNLLKFPFLYYDTDAHLMIVLSETPLAAEGLPEGYTGRLVHSTGELVEKIKVFETGLDDIVVEMCKFVTCQEMGKTVPFKFAGMDGADNEMTFTYPENGQMEMVAVGFNVYEDCAGILQRNPYIRESATGLATIDQAWLAKFFR